MLDYRAVARRTMNAILQNESEVCIPWTMGFLSHLCKALFPAPIVDFLCWLLLGYESIIGNFKGRVGQKNALNYIASKE